MKKVIVAILAVAVGLVMAGTPAMAGTGKKADGKKSSAAVQTVKVNINTASVDQLTTLKGIGQKKAEAIVAFRTEHGNFKKTEDIMLVKGIGPKMYEKLKNFITVQ